MLIPNSKPRIESDCFENAINYKGFEQYNTAWPSPLCNRNIFGDKSRGPAVKLYRENFQEYLKEEAFRAEFNKLVEISRKKNLLLLCYCRSGPCHATVIRDELRKL